MYAGSFLKSWMWTNRCVLATRASAVPGSGMWKPAVRRCFASGPGVLCIAATRKPSPSASHKVANCALHIRAAFFSMALNTGCRSPWLPEMTLSTSLVAVCWSNAADSCFSASSSLWDRSASCFFRLVEDGRARFEIVVRRRRDFVALTRLVGCFMAIPSLAGGIVPAKPSRLEGLAGRIRRRHRAPLSLPSMPPGEALRNPPLPGGSFGTSPNRALVQADRPGPSPGQPFSASSSNPPDYGRSPPRRASVFVAASVRRLTAA
jgi:hypothetical protein